MTESQGIGSKVITIQNPPATTGGILRRLGPGMIIAGAIVGSGELIATTKVGAEAGFTLLWLIILGCLIKVFVQIEFGRYSIVQGRTSMDGMNELPGPRLRANWLMWYWLAMFLSGLGQLGGIVGGVGTAVAISLPITGDYVEQLEQRRVYQDELNELIPTLVDPNSPGSPDVAMSVARKRAEQQLGPPPADEYTWDDVYWGGIITVLTAILLVNGRYGLIQALATVFVAGFTFVTLLSLIGLQYSEQLAIRWSDIREGLSFNLPGNDDAGNSAIFSALAAFGIIGVGASELIAYPYWCLEKGYARFTGPRDDSQEWAERARGWLRVMRWDAWCSMVVYTTATLAFYVLGATILFRNGLNPEGTQMIPTLRNMYTQNTFFAGWGDKVFLLGAFAVLYSTFFVATAGNARMAADALRVFRVGAATNANRLWWTRVFCGIFPFLSLSIYIVSKNPVTLVLIGGFMQSIMLPMLGSAALYFRFWRQDARLRPTRLWDVFLAVSVLGLFVVGSKALYDRVMDVVHWLANIGQ